jgi:hypothetical protein
VFLDCDMTSFGRLFLYCLVLRACVLLLSSQCTNCLSPNLVFHIYMLFSLPYVARMTFNICDVDTTRWGAWAALGWRAVTSTSLHFTPNDVIRQAFKLCGLRYINDQLPIYSTKAISSLA